MKRDSSNPRMSTGLTGPIVEVRFVPGSTGQALRFSRRPPVKREPDPSPAEPLETGGAR